MPRLADAGSWTPSLTEYRFPTVRNVVFRFPDLASMFDTLASARHSKELPLPADLGANDGEWVLSTFESAFGRKATAAAGRAVVPDPSNASILFEERDWERLLTFCGPAAQAAVEADEPPLSIPVLLEDASPESLALSPRSSSPGGPVSVRGPISVQMTDAKVTELASIGAAAAEEEAPPLTQRAPGDTASAVPSSARVLFVDDDADTRDMVALMLEAVGLEVESCADAEAALQLLEKETFHIVVLDWWLPGMSGLQLCRTVRTSQRFVSMPLLFLTANTSSQDMLQAFACGADDYVTKPFRAAELGARIFALLRRSFMQPPKP